MLAATDPSSSGVVLLWAVKWITRFYLGTLGRLSFSMRLSGSLTAPGEFGSAGVRARWAPARTLGWGWPWLGAPGLARRLVGHGLALDRVGRQGVGERPARPRALRRSDRNTHSSEWARGCSGPTGPRMAPIGRRSTGRRTPTASPPTPTRRRPRGAGGQTPPASAANPSSPGTSSPRRTTPASARTTAGSPGQQHRPRPSVKGT